MNSSQKAQVPEIIIGKTDTELLIVTNNHVVAGSDTLTVAFTDESTVEANIKGTDAQYDVAVIAVPIENISDDTLDVNLSCHSG